MFAKLQFKHLLVKNDKRNNLAKRMNGKYGNNNASADDDICLSYQLKLIIFLYRLLENFISRLILSLCVYKCQHSKFEIFPVTCMVNRFILRTFNVLCIIGLIL